MLSLLQLTMQAQQLHPGMLPAGRQGEGSSPGWQPKSSSTNQHPLTALLVGLEWLGLTGW